MPIYYLRFHASPKEDLQDSEDLGGAFINCWIEEASKKLAEKAAIKVINDAGWDIIELEEVSLDGKENYLNNPEGLEYYEQALIDKSVIVIYSYPIEDEEDREENE